MLSAMLMCVLMRWQWLMEYRRFIVNSVIGGKD